MIRKIDIFMPPAGQYEMLPVFTRELYEAFGRLGVQSRLLIAERNNPEPFLESIFSDPPDCTLSFNGLLPDKEGRFFCDMIKIPHVAYLTCSPNLYFNLSGSPLNIITCPDQYGCTFFEGLNFKNTLFMPTGVGKELKGDVNSKRKYEVVFLASCIDYEGIRESWKDQFEKPLVKALEDAAERVFSDEKTTYVEALVLAINEQAAHGLDPTKINYIEVLDQLEQYIAGKDRVELVRAIKDVKVDIIGAPSLTASWEKYVGDQSNVTLHDPIPYEDALEVMKKSQILLNSSPWMKHGPHERVLTGMACGAVVVTNENVYMSKHFTDGSDVIFYRHGKWGEVNDRLQELVSDSDARESVALRSRNKVLSKHTWDVRASALLKELPKLIKQIKAGLA